MKVQWLKDLAVKIPWLTVVLPAGVGALATILLFRFAFQYALIAFIGIPVTVGFLSAMIKASGEPTTFGRCFTDSLLALLMLSAFLFLFGWEGIICIIMAFPLCMAALLAGTWAGWVMAIKVEPATKIVPPLLLFGLPMMLAFDFTEGRRPPLRKVVTVVEVNAPAQKVWDVVVAFPPINKAPTGILALGIAYPISARMEGRGIGAMRYCTFSTGSFVEPITVWDEPRLLAFDVTENPPAMQEISIWRNLETPHMTGHMVSEKGQFRLVERNGKTFLEGTTWYRHHMSPQFYWGTMSDEIIHQIHHRVLNHIKEVAESR